LHEVPSLAVGVHLALVEERPLADGVTTLVGVNGLFHEGYSAVVPRYLAGRLSLDEIERELRAQIELVFKSGLRVTHFNGHQHLHLLPKVFEIVQHLAAEYGVDYIRIVDEPHSLSMRGFAI